eukprot:SAG31_NODE_5799_length_2323_cov_1.375899_2_plen_184_part_00
MAAPRFSTGTRPPGIMCSFGSGASGSSAGASGGGFAQTTEPCRNCTSRAQEAASIFPPSEQANFSNRRSKRSRDSARPPTCRMRLPAMKVRRACRGSWGGGVVVLRFGGHLHSELVRKLDRLALGERRTACKGRSCCCGPTGSNRCREGTAVSQMRFHRGRAREQPCPWESSPGNRCEARSGH